VLTAQLKPRLGAVTTAAHRPSVQLVIGRVANAASMYIGLLLISILAGFEVRGRIDILLQAGALLALLSGLGGPLAMAYYTVRCRLTLHVVLMWYGISTLFCILVAAGVSTFRGSIGLDHLDWVGVFLSLVLFGVGMNAIVANSHVSIALNRATPILRGQVASAVLILAIAVVSPTLFPRVSQAVVVAGFGLSYLAGSYVIWRNLVDWRQRRPTEVVPLVTFLQYGLRSAAGQVGVSVSLRGDILMVAALRPTADVGRYATALLLMESTQLVSSALGGMIFVGLSSAIDEKERERRLRRYRRRLVATTALIVVSVMILAFFLQRLYFPGSQLVLLCALLAPGYVLWVAGATTSGLYLASIGKPGAASLGYIAGGIVMLGIDVLLIPPLGLNGAAIGSSIGYGTSALFLTLARIHNARTATQPGFQ